jgi:acetate kinase
MLKFVDEKGSSLQETASVPDHGSATKRVFDWLVALGYLSSEGIDSVGYRVVHGGPHFVEPTLIDERVLEAIEAISNLALLHNHPSIEAIRMAKVMLGPGTPMVAVFDTTFHSDMPERASHYPVPVELAAKHHIWRYGFHGIAHQYMLERYVLITSTPMEKTRIITLQLGSGCSASAIEKGRSIDTSMGLTPLEGLMMGTRSGDVDPHLPGFLAEREGISLSDAEAVLNKKSGLLGISGHSQDMRELLERESQGDADAALAIEMFSWRSYSPQKGFREMACHFLIFFMPWIESPVLPCGSSFMRPTPGMSILMGENLYLKTSSLTRRDTQAALSIWFLPTLDIWPLTPSPVSHAPGSWVRGTVWLPLIQSTSC